MRMMPCGDSFSLVCGSGQIMNDGSILVDAVFGFHQPKVIDNGPVLVVRHLFEVQVGAIVGL